MWDEIAHLFPNFNGYTDTIRYGTVRYGTLWCGVVVCGVMWCGVAHFLCHIEIIIAWIAGLLIIYTF